MKPIDKFASTHLLSDKIIDSLNGIAAVWTFISLLGLVLFPGHFTFFIPFWGGLISLASFGNFWNLMQKQGLAKKHRQLALSNFFIWVFFLVQSFTICITLITWNLFWEDKWPVWIWMFASISGAIALSYLSKKDQHPIIFSKREFGILLASPIWAVLTGTGLRELVYFYFRHQEIPPLGQLSLFVVNAGLVVLTFQLFLLFSLPLPSRVVLLNWPITARSMPKWLQALALSSAFILGSLFVFNIGYSVYDDVCIVTLASGYPGGEAVPYLIHINVLIGLIFNKLYALSSHINWYTFTLIGLNLCALWGGIYLILSRPLKTKIKVLGMLAVLICDLYFLINPTYTTVVAFAAIVGSTLIMAACEKDQPVQKSLLPGGIALIVFASLLRLLPVFMILLLISPILFIYIGSFHIKALAWGGAIFALCIAFLSVFNFLYLSASPEWNAYYAYNTIRIKVFDTPRLTNMNETISDIGWSKLDMAAFQHSFSPDAETFSRENLEYIATHTSDKQGSLVSTLLSMPERLSSAHYLPYGLLLLSALAGILFRSPSIKRDLLAIFSVMVLSSLLCFYLFWTQKLPDRILMPVMAANVIAAWLVLLWPGMRQATYIRRISHIGQNSILLFLFLAGALSLTQAVEASHSNLEKHQTYLEIAHELELLKDTGVLVPNALIVSPANGIPMEWSNPLFTDFPKVKYMAMGWMTFSPTYQNILRRAGAASLPEGLYENDNIYLMTSPNRLDIIIQFIKQHEGIDVTATEIMDVSKYTQDQIYAKVRLYKLQASRP